VPQALQYQEEYLLALEAFSKSGDLDPTWDLPRDKEKKLMSYLETAQQLVTTQGKQRPKKLHTMLKVCCPKLSAGNFSL
jgi:hypothetical protein